MGQCQSKGLPKPISIQELVNTKIGEVYESQTGCGPSIEGTQAGSGYQQLKDKGLSWPQNGEFVWNGLGSDCYLCSDVSSYGCDCGDGRGASVGGKRGTIKRVAYNGGEYNCSVSQSSIDTDYINPGGVKMAATCDPKYRDVSSGAADASLLKFCAISDNISTSPTCVKWASQRPDVAKNISLDYCSKDNNMNTEFCKRFCSENTGLCDNAALGYCSRNPDDTDFCGCINIPEELQVVTKSGVSIKPQCNLNQCIKAEAYKTQSMLDDKSCPTINICEQTLNIASLDQSQLQGVSFSCSQTTNTSQNASAPVEISGKSTQSKLQNIVKDIIVKDGMSNNTIIIIITVVLAILLMLSASSVVLII